MKNIDARIALNIERLEQLKRQKKVEDARDKKQKEAIDLRRKIIVGNMIVKYFPEILNFQPRRTTKETDIAFAPVEVFMSILAEDEHYVSSLKEKVRKKLSNV
jgi:hypothetical protein